MPAAGKSVVRLKEKASWHGFTLAKAARRSAAGSNSTEAWTKAVPGRRGAGNVQKGDTLKALDFTCTLKEGLASLKAAGSSLSRALEPTTRRLEDAAEAAFLFAARRQWQMLSALLMSPKA